MDRTPATTPAELSEWTTPASDALIAESVPQLLARRLPAIHARRALLWPVGDHFEQLTYRELADAATLVARALATTAAPGERVGIWSRNSVEWVILHYACALSGTIAAPFNTAWTDSELRYAIDLTTPAVVFAGPGRDGGSLVGRAREVAGPIPVHDLADLITWASTVPAGDLPQVTPDAPLLIQFTSGTTGRFKGALQSHRALLSSAALRAAHDVIPDDDVWLNPIPYHHVGGFCHVILGGLVDGGAMVVIDRFSADEMLRLLGMGEITRIGGVPTMIDDIADRILESGRTVALTSVATGAATVTQHLIDKVRNAFGAVIVTTYGQSECPTITDTEPGADPATLGATIGRPVAGTTVRIVDPATGRTVPLGTVGEIRALSPCTMLGYWGMPEQTAETIGPDGYLATGDLASMSAGGYIAFAGRARDVIIRGGENIYPAEIEEILLAHPGVAAAILVGVDDRRLGERVAAAVIRAPGTAVTVGELTEYLRNRLAYFKIPATWRFVDSFPMTASGKIQRFRIREMFDAEAAGDRSA
ncbi:class I adenylate-forming enzyme family protein [Nocardia aurantia]|uniref:3-[(3aS,4S,7aS)-7a-methyl-1, 5-dioxo-octahydro-1H-inden-4-yl]propanoyl:CoA ligase n=1 Tax=Nocardia aurantia TaxID=2585199 RepID=A0A7K0DK74_9NOCA|nr:class I adenylate-forming enzyme family protein [Nocardia aurantia]MQY26067.1 3-[(3aS,4S,7aS)-7a-methyl-1,5-dioxo-octahydro-1H-inden-4-yl]propanoyl:CoA ligase [Nocardia aurantia]